MHSSKSVGWVNFVASPNLSTEGLPFFLLNPSLSLPKCQGEPVLPINIVAFDPSIVGNDDEKAG